MPPVTDRKSPVTKPDRAAAKGDGIGDILRLSFRRKRLFCAWRDISSSTGKAGLFFTR